MRRAFGVLAVLLLLAAPAVHACDACFGAEDSPLIDGARMGAAALVLVTFGVQGGFVAFFIHLWRRARKASRAELDTEWSEFQKDSR